METFELYNPTDFFSAVKTENLDKVKNLVEKYREVININQTDENGNNALMLACNGDYRDPSVAKYLIENFKERIDINQVNNEGNNALMLSCNYIYDKRDSRNESYTEVMKIIVENYKDVIDLHHTNKKGNTVLTFVSDNEDVVEFLLKNCGHTINSKKIKNIVSDEFEGPLETYVTSEEYKIKKFESIDTIFVKVGNFVKCYTVNNTIKYNGVEEDNKKLLLNVDTGYGIYTKIADVESNDTIRAHYVTDTILYSN